MIVGFIQNVDYNWEMQSVNDMNKYSGFDHGPSKNRMSAMCQQKKKNQNRNYLPQDRPVQRL